MVEIMPSVENTQARILVIGVGGAGNNAVNRMVDENVQGVELVGVNTDRQALSLCKASTKIQIGEKLTKGLGAGAKPEVGEKAAIESKEDIKQLLAGTQLLFLTAGMGGGTGTGAIPVVAEIAQEMGIQTIAIVTKPFLFEGRLRSSRADVGIEKLKQHVNSLILISNDKLLKVAGNQKMSVINAFKMADNVLEQGIKSITDLITSVGDINVDFADITTMLTYKGMAYMGIGEAKGEGRMVDAVNQAIDNALTENKINNAKGVIFNVRGNSELALSEINDGIGKINDLISEDANVVFGTITDESLDDKVVVTVIATGVE